MVTGKHDPPKHDLLGLDDVPWARLRGAYGSAESVPAILRAIASAAPGEDLLAVGDLTGAICHQGTIYDCTPEAVPFLAALIADARQPDQTRALLGLVLAVVAGPTNFVTGEPPEAYRTASQRGTGDPIPQRELDQECRQAVVGSLSLLEPSFLAGPTAVRAALVAVAAATNGSLTGVDVEAVSQLAAAEDPCLANAARLTIALNRLWPLGASELTQYAAVDEEATDYLVDLSDHPIREQAVQLVLALCERAVAKCLN